MLDVMIDLETMGTQPDAAIVAIAAVEFDPAAQAIGRQLYTPVQLASSVAAGGTMDPATVLWWLQQAQPARAELCRADAQPLAPALQQLAAWLHWPGADRGVRVWGNGAAFDNVLLRGAYQRLQLQVPWAWHNDRCFRTLRKALPHVAPPAREGTTHHALDDALHQARHAVRLLGALPRLHPVGAGDGNTYVVR